MGAYIDHVENLALQEKGGVVRSLTRLARIVFSPDDAVSNDVNVLLDALDELNAVPGSNPDDFAVPAALGPKFSALMLDERNVAIHDKNTKSFDVILVYRHLMDGTQELGGTGGKEISGSEMTDGTNLYGRMRCSLQQKQTNFYYDDLGDKQQVVLSHYYPARGEDGFDPNDNYSGRTVTQGGQFNILVPQKNYRFEVFIETNDPWLWASGILGKVNAEPWLTDLERTWLCTEVEWEILETGRYKMTMEFQHDTDTWDPTVVFIDDRSGRPPPGLKGPDDDPPGNGWQVIEYLDETDFEQYFGASFEGSAGSGIP